MALSKTDPSSFSTPEDALVKELHLVLDVNFTQKVLNGYVDVTVEKTSPTVETLVISLLSLTLNESETESKSQTYEKYKRVIPGIRHTMFIVNSYLLPPTFSRISLN